MTVMRSPLGFMLRHRWGWLLVIVSLTFGAAFFGLAAPFFQKVFVDRLTLTTPAEWYGDTHFSRVETQLFSFHALALLFAAFLAMLFSQWLTTLANWLGVREALKRQEVLGETVYRKTMSMRLDQTLGQTVGEVVSIYATDVPGATAIVDQTIPLGAGILFPFICAPLVVQWICDIPVGLTVTVMLAVLSVSVILSIRQSRFFQMFKKLAADRTGLVNEWIQNVRLLRILGWVESYEKKIFRKREEETVNRVRMVTNGQMMGAFGSSINFFMNLAAVVTLAKTKGASATPGDYFALLWIFGVFLSRPLRQVPWIFTFTLDGLTSLRRIENFLRRHPESLQTLEDKAANRSNSKPVGKESMSLDIQGLRLNLDGRPVLDDISFQLRAGEFTAVVGEVGSGKSLLLMSLLGETAAEFASMKVGDVEFAKKSREERRAIFGFVPQDGFVMSATLRENVIFRYEAGAEFDHGILEALKAAQFDPAREGVIDGLATEVGERGVNLSGGQKQRIGLARSAYLSRPVILIDDALSAVDVETEKFLFKTLLFGAWQSATRLMVTHRLSVLDQVDRVLFMQEGRVVDSGRFAELVARNKDFRDFVHSMGPEAGGSPQESSAPKPDPSNGAPQGDADPVGESV